MGVCDRRRDVVLKERGRSDAIWSLQASLASMVLLEWFGGRNTLGQCLRERALARCKTWNKSREAIAGDWQVGGIQVLQCYNMVYPSVEPRRTYNHMGVYEGRCESGCGVEWLIAAIRDKKRSGPCRQINFPIIHIHLHRNSALIFSPVFDLLTRL